MASRKGSVVIFVILICAALLLLGTSLLDMNSLDLKIAANQRDSLQAYYLAETGIETALAVLHKEDPGYTGVTELAFLGGKIGVEVSAVEGADGGRQVTILSRGSVGAASELLWLQFQSFPRHCGGTDGAQLGWYDQLSGEIRPGFHTGDGGAVYLASTAMALEQDVAAEGEELSMVFSAAEIHFDSMPLCLLAQDCLVLQSEAVVFRGRVVLAPPAGMLRFYHPAGAEVRVYLRDGIFLENQHLLLGAGVYSFPHGFLLAADMTAGQVEYRVLPVVPGSMVRRDGRVK